MTSPALEQLAGRVRAASRLVATAPSSVRDDALGLAADLLDEEWSSVLEANRTDLERAEAAGLTDAARDRLRLDEDRVRAMAGGLRKVAALADPVGEVTEGWVRPNGLRVTRVRVPLGVIGVIYENRPNVTSDAAGLCLKAGNAAFLRGSSSALASNQAVVALLRRAVAKAGLPEDAVALVDDTSHETAIAFMQLRGLVDCLIPRGGPALIASLVEHATVPYVLDGDGNCHIYIDGAADLAMAHELAVNAKTHRFGVCNAVETILVHQGIAAALLPRLAASLAASGVEIRADERVRGAGPRRSGGARGGLRHRVPRPRRRDRHGRRRGRRHRAHHAVQLGSLRGHRHLGRRRGRPLRGRGRRGGRVGERVDTFRRRRGARPGGGGRDLHPEAARSRADGSEGVDDVEMGRARGRAGATVSSAGLGLPEAGPARFENLDEVRGGLARVGYLADDSISGVVFLADRLAKPVLVEGPAGTGKTQLAKSVADLTGARLIRLQCYEGLDESKALYEWNYRKQLLRIQAGEHGQGETEGPSWHELEGDIFSEEFLLTRPLLEAIRATEPVVLLIDEVDRVELETEALLLEILSEYQVSIPELGTVRATQLPMVFLTSNNTRELSEALKRRCLYLHLDYPDLDREREIVRNKVPGISEELADQVARIVRSLRTLELRKAPSVSETLDWARTLVLLGVQTIDAAGAKDTLHILLKYQADIERASKELLSASSG